MTVFDADLQAYRSTFLSIVPDAEPEEVAAVLAVLAMVSGDATIEAETPPPRRPWARSLQPTVARTAEPFGWASSVHQFRS